jgi:hypothetical protein
MLNAIRNNLKTDAHKSIFDKIYLIYYYLLFIINLIEFFIVNINLEKGL